MSNEINRKTGADNNPKREAVPATKTKKGPGFKSVLTVFVLLILGAGGWFFYDTVRKDYGKLAPGQSKESVRKKYARHIVLDYEGFDLIPYKDALIAVVYENNKIKAVIVHSRDGEPLYGAPNIKNSLINTADMPEKFTYAEFGEKYGAPYFEIEQGSPAYVTSDGKIIYFGDAANDLYINMSVIDLTSGSVEDFYEKRPSEAQNPTADNNDNKEKPAETGELPRTKQNANYGEVVREGKNFEVSDIDKYYSGGRYQYYIFTDDGDVIEGGITEKTYPEFKLIGKNENILRLGAEDADGVKWARYYDLKSGRKSDRYTPVPCAESEEFTAYMTRLNNKNVLAVQDIFSKQKYFKTFDRNFSDAYAIIEAEFSADGNELTVTFKQGTNSRTVTETLTVRKE